MKYDSPCRTIDDPVDFAGKEELDALAFPLSKKEMIHNLQMYLAVAMKYVQDKSQETPRPRLNTLRAKHDAMSGFIKHTLNMIVRGPAFEPRPEPFHSCLFALLVRMCR